MKLSRCSTFLHNFVLDAFLFQSESLYSGTPINKAILCQTTLIEKSSQAQFFLLCTHSRLSLHFLSVTAPARLVHPRLPLHVDIGVQVPSPVGSEQVEQGRCHRGQEALY